MRFKGHVNIDPNMALIWKRTCVSGRLHSVFDKNILTDFVTVISNRDHFSHAVISSFISKIGSRLLSVRQWWWITVASVYGQITSDKWQITHIQSKCGYTSLWGSDTDVRSNYEWNNYETLHFLISPSSDKMWISGLIEMNIAQQRICYHQKSTFKVRIRFFPSMAPIKR